MKKLESLLEKSEHIRYYTDVLTQEPPLSTSISLISDQIFMALLILVDIQNHHLQKLLLNVLIFCWSKIMAINVFCTAPVGRFLDTLKIPSNVNLKIAEYAVDEDLKKMDFVGAIDIFQMLA